MPNNEPQKQLNDGENIVSNSTPEQQWLEEFVQGKSLREILNWQQARALTGYTYEELKNIVSDPDNEDGLDQSDIKAVDESVNLLLHLVNKYIAKTQS